ncbi:MAG: hypothetical protein WCA20_34605 [Candidatus Sulfotelmatobacter sp.]
MDVETKDLRGEGMLGGEGFGAPYALLPGSNSHGAIMGLRLGGRQLLKSFHHKGTDGMVERIPSITSVRLNFQAGA